MDPSYCLLVNHSNARALDSVFETSHFGFVYSVLDYHSDLNSSFVSSFITTQTPLFRSVRTPRVGETADEDREGA